MQKCRLFLVLAVLVFGLKFERDRFLIILETNSENAAILFKRLAKTLGKRLIETYPTTV